VCMMVVCSGLGFLSAIAALCFADVSLYQAFCLWMSGGFSAMIMAVLPLLVPPPAARDADRAKTV